MLSLTRRSLAACLRLLIAAAGSATLIPLAGCVVISTSSGCAEQARFTSTKTAKVAASGAVGLDVETQNGAISAMRSDAEAGVGAIAIEVTVRAITQARADTATVVTNQGPDGSLTIRVDWPDGKRQQNEGASVDVRLPETKWVRLRSDNGSLTCGGLAGVGELRTSNGAIRITDHAGDTKAITTNGSIEAKDIRGSFAAESVNGRIEGSGIGGFVTAETTNGRVVIALADGSPGPVKIETTNGSVELKLGSGFQGELRASTTNGSIDESLAGAVRKSGGRKDRTFGFTAEGVRSEISTTNGSITVRGPM